MSVSVAAISIFFLVSLSSSSMCSAFNISKILSEYPEFSSFNDLLNQTKLVPNINSRRTITVLAVDNSAISQLSGMSQDEQRAVLSVHVILDYYDKEKFSKMRRKWRIVTTLYQTSGKARNMQGFLNVSKTENGIVFKSAVSDATSTASLVGSVASQPYNVSVLQVSNVIVPPDMSSWDGDTSKNTTAPPKKAPSPKKAHAPSPDSDSDSDAASPPEPDVDYDYPDSPSDAPAPAPAPTGKKSSSKNAADTRFGVSVGVVVWAAMTWLTVVVFV